MMKKGHPWVTRDEFTKKFPDDGFILRSKNSIDGLWPFLIHDPTHPKVKARVWKLSENKDGK